MTAANATLISLANKMESETEWSKAFWAAGGFASGVVFTPFASVGMLKCVVVEDINHHLLCTCRCLVYSNLASLYNYNLIINRTATHRQSVKLSLVGLKYVIKKPNHNFIIRGAETNMQISD